MVLVGTGAVATFAVAVVINCITKDAVADVDPDDDDDDDTATASSLPPAGPRNNFTVPQSYSRA